jgi:YjbE family integral membrane protein
MFDPASIGTAFEALMTDIGTSSFWIGVAKIIGVDLILAGDNAVVIALACRKLPAHQRFWGIIIGTAVAVLMRVIFTLTVSQLMMLSFVKIIGGIALFYIAVKLLQDDSSHDETSVESGSTLFSAIRIIVIADVVMSLDNVLGIAGAAAGHNSQTILIIFGLLVSIPLVVFGAQLVMRLLHRFPSLLWAGGALLGWIAGQVIATDPVVREFFSPGWKETIETIAVSGSVFVTGGGTLLGWIAAPLVASDAVIGKTALDWATIVEMIAAVTGALLVLLIAWRINRKKNPRPRKQKKLPVDVVKETNSLSCDKAA